MTNTKKAQTLPFFSDPVDTATLTIQACTNTQRIKILGLCLSMSKVVAAISQIEETQNNILRCVTETDQHHQALLLKLKWKNLSTLSLLRQALAHPDEKIEQVHSNYTPNRSNTKVRINNSQPDRFYSQRATVSRICQGCHYDSNQFGRSNFLVCAVHPDGLVDSDCQEGVSAPSYHPQYSSIKRN